LNLKILNNGDVYYEAKENGEYFTVINGVEQR
jgi:hypothetical protein